MNTKISKMTIKDVFFQETNYDFYEELKQLALNNRYSSMNFVLPVGKKDLKCLPNTN